jgi:hypothetical protein
VIESQIPQVIRRKDSCGFGAGVDELLCGFNYIGSLRPTDGRTSLPLQYMQCDLVVLLFVLAASILICVEAPEIGSILCCFVTNPFVGSTYLHALVCLPNCDLSWQKVNIYVLHHDGNF